MKGGIDMKYKHLLLLGSAALACIVTVKKQMHLGPCSMELDDKFRKMNEDKKISLREAYVIVKNANPGRNITGYIDTENSKKFKDYYVFGACDGIIDSCLMCVDKKSGRVGSIHFTEWDDVLSHNEGIDIDQIEELKDIT